MEQNITLRFNGSVWCNLDVALRNVDRIFRRTVRPLELTVIEWYVLRALYEEDCQNPSVLAQTVGRAATSFTPNLDKLEKKGLIERKPDSADRRAINICLTPKGEELRADVTKSSEQLDKQIRNLFPEDTYNSFLQVIYSLQSVR